MNNKFKSYNTNKLRLKLFRGNRNIYAQIIDDQIGHTVCSASTIKLSENGIKASIICAQNLAKKALEKSISSIVFDRGNYLYKGRIKTFVEELRRNGIEV